jgi:hypothetical protein
MVVGSSGILKRMWVTEVKESDKTKLGIKEQKSRMREERERKEEGREAGRLVNFCSTWEITLGGIICTG